MLKNKVVNAVFLAAALAASAGSASAAVIDFNGLAGTAMPGGEADASPYKSYTYFGPAAVSNVGGYSFSSDAWHMYSGSEWSMVYGGGLPGRDADNGTDFLHTDGVLRVTRTGGGSFNLNGLSLDNFYDDDQWHGVAAQASYTISATLAAGGKVSTVVTLDDKTNATANGSAAAFNQFSLHGFTNITSFEISSEIKDLPWGRGTNIALDDLDVSSNLSPVPEPSSWAMLGLGLLTLVACGRRRKA